jgi:hypothetical protein
MNYICVYIKIMFYIIGDSHVSAFVNDSTIINTDTVYTDNIFSVIRTEPFTVYNLNNKINYIQQLIDMFKNINSSDYLFLCYGEVDVRCHIGFIADNTGKKYNEVCEDVINRYLLLLNEMKKIHPNIGVYGPIPSGPYNGINGNGRHSYKTQKERNYITDIFNKILEDKCNKNNIIFKNIKEKPDNTFSDGIHFNGKIKSKLIKLFSDIN